MVCEVLSGPVIAFYLPLKMGGDGGEKDCPGSAEADHLNIVHNFTFMTD